MTIIRADGWTVKPGRQPDIRQFASEMKPLIRKHGGNSPRLMRIAIGGSSSGLMYGEFETEDLEDHGRVVGAIQSDEHFQRLSASFNSPDGPTTGRVTLLVDVVAELGARTESIEGCVESIQTFKIAPDRRSQFLDLAGELASFTDQHEARLRVLQMLTGSDTGNMSYVIEFADLSRFGRYADDIWAQPAFRDLITRIRAVGEHTDGSLHAEIIL